MKPIVIEKFADNGEFSHYELIGSDGVVLWAGQEDETYYYPDKFIQKFANKMIELSNRLNEIEDVEEGYLESDDYDIKQKYLSDIRDFICKTNIKL